MGISKPKFTTGAKAILQEISIVPVATFDIWNIGRLDNFLAKYNKLDEIVHKDKMLCEYSCGLAQTLLKECYKLDTKFFYQNTKEHITYRMVDDNGVHQLDLKGPEVHQNKTPVSCFYSCIQSLDDLKRNEDDESIYPQVESEGDIIDNEITFETSNLVL